MTDLPPLVEALHDNWCLNTECRRAGGQVDDCLFGSDLAALATSAQWHGKNQAAAQVLTCAFCGHEYPPGTPRSQHELLTEHIKTCKQHPAAAAIREARTQIIRDVAKNHICSGAKCNLPLFRCSWFEGFRLRAGGHDEPA